MTILGLTSPFGCFRSRLSWWIMQEDAAARFVAVLPSRATSALGPQATAIQKLAGRKCGWMGCGVQSHWKPLVCNGGFGWLMGFCRGVNHDGVPMLRVRSESFYDASPGSFGPQPGR